MSIRWHARYAADGPTTLMPGPEAGMLDNLAEITDMLGSLIDLAVIPNVEATGVIGVDVTVSQFDAGVLGAVAAVLARHGFAADGDPRVICSACRYVYPAEVIVLGHEVIDPAVESGGTSSHPSSCPQSEAHAARASDDDDEDAADDGAGGGFRLWASKWIGGRRPKRRG